MFFYIILLYFFCYLCCQLLGKFSSIRIIRTNMTTILVEGAFITETIQNKPPPLNTSQSQTLKLLHHQKVDKKLLELSENTINKICIDLQQNKLQINTAKTDLRFDQKTAANLQAINRQRDEIMQKKTQMLDDLKNLEQIQLGLVKQSKQYKTKQRNRLSMSHISMEDIQTIKSLKAKKKQHDQQMQRKIREYEESLKKYQQQTRSIDQNRKLKQASLRKKAAAQKIQAFTEKQANRKIQIQKEKQELSRLKSQQKLFQKIQAAAKTEDQKLQKYFKAQLNVKRMERKLSHGDLKSREAAYLKRRQEEQSARKSKIKQKQEALAQSTPKFQVIFLQEAMKQKKSQQQQQLHKWNQIVVNKQKRQIFSENVRKQAKTQLVINSQSKLFINQTKKNQGLERSTVFQRGNQYMKLGNSFVNSKRCNTQMGSIHLPPIVKQEPQEKQQAKQNKVVDYLKERRLKRKHIDSHTKLQNCLKQGKIDKAIDLLGILQGKKHNPGSQWKTCMSKIRVLQQLKNREDQ